MDIPTHNRITKLMMGAKPDNR